MKPEERADEVFNAIGWEVFHRNETEAKRKITDALRDAETAATLRERERCANVAEVFACGAAAGDPEGDGRAEYLANSIAAVIRRGD
jgi:hypothetical protein